MNINQFNDVVELAELAGINEVRLLKFVPQGRGRENKEVLQLPNEELLMFIKDCQSIKTKKNISFLGEKKSITFDEKLGALPTPQRFGYTFGGWLFNDEVVTSETVVKYDGNMPLKAKWIPIVAEVEYVLNDGINHQDNPNSYTIEDGNIRLLPAEKEGYRFMGWYLDEQFTTRISEFSYAEYQQGITLYARFEKLYTVTYVLNKN